MKRLDDVQRLIEQKQFSEATRVLESIRETDLEAELGALIDKSVNS